MPGTEPITEPGLFDLTAETYHADPVAGRSLSSSGARKLLPPSCPALFHYWQHHPRPPKVAFDLGHAAHRVVLGVGAEIVVVEADDWRTKAAREARDEAHAAGLVPLLRDDADRVHAMAAALRAEPLAAALLSPDRGRAEQTLVWQDTATGVMCRSMLDHQPHIDRTRRMVVADYKSTDCAYPPAFARSAASYGYHQQAAFYLDGVRALGLDDDPAFVFVAQEKAPPYLVSVVELEPEDMALGARLNRRAREIYRDCTASGIWPGYTTDIERIALPTWSRRQQEEALVDY